MAKSGISQASPHDHGSTAPRKVSPLTPIFSKEIWASLAQYQSSESWIFKRPTSLMATASPVLEPKINIRSLYTYFDKTPEEIEKANEEIRKSEEKKLRMAEVSEASKLENVITRTELKRIHMLGGVYKQGELAIVARHAELARFRGQRRKEKAFIKRAYQTVMHKRTRKIPAHPIAPRRTPGPLKHVGRDMFKRKAMIQHHLVDDSVGDCLIALEGFSISDNAVQKPLLAQWSERAEALLGRNISSFKEALNILVTKEDDQPFSAGPDKFWRTSSHKGPNYERNQKKRAAQKKKLLEMANDPAKAAQAAEKKAKKAADMKALARKIVAKRAFQDDEDNDEQSQSRSENPAPRKILKAKAKRRHATITLFHAVFSAFAGIKNGEWTIATKNNDLIKIRKHDETKKVMPSVFAKKDIKYSQEIFREAYFLRRPEANDKASLAEKDKLRQEGFVAMLSKINSEKYKQFMALRSVCSCIKEGTLCRCSPLDKRWKCNFWYLPDNANNSGTVMYLIASLVQHSCDPNAVCAFTANGSIVVAATRDIKAGEAITMSVCVEEEPYRKRKIEMRARGILSCNCKFCKQNLPTPPLGAMAIAAENILIKDDPSVPPLSMRTEVEIQARDELEAWIDEFELRKQLILNACCNDWYMMASSIWFPGPDLTKYIRADGTFEDKTPMETYIEETMKLLTDPSAPVDFPVDVVSEIVRGDIMRCYNLCKKRWTEHWKEGKRGSWHLFSNVEGEAKIKMQAYQEWRKKAREEQAKIKEAEEKK